MTHQPQDGAAPDRRAENREVAVRLLAERCRLQARQAVLEPAVGIPLMTGVIVMLHPAIGADQLVPWALLLGATLLLRAFCAARFIARRRYDTADYLTLTAVFNLTAGLSGLLVGACAGLFFAQVTHADRLSLTIVIFAWLALGVLMYAPFAPRWRGTGPARGRVVAGTRGPGRADRPWRRALRGITCQAIGSFKPCPHTIDTP
jgi:hypothetical protein